MLQSNGARPLPPFFIGQQITQDRIDRFVQEKHPLLSNAIGKPDTKAIWYSRDHVAQWLSEIDKNGADGMRVYFGTQGDTEDYPGQTCLLMVLTKKDEVTGVHTDFTIEEEADFNDRSINKNEDSNLKRDFNTGAPCPPICGTGVSFGQ